MGEIVSQIIHFSKWNKRTYHNIDTSTIQDGSMCKFKIKWWKRMILVNTINVDCIEVFSNNQD